MSRAETGFERVAPIAPPCTDGSDLTANELAWVDFPRLISGGNDPRPTLRRVQLLRRVLRRRKPRGVGSGW